MKTASNIIIGMLLSAFLLSCASLTRTAIPPGPAGDIVFVLYTIDNDTLKLTAQMYPLTNTADRTAYLDIYEDSGWRTVAETDIIEPGGSAPFRVENWDMTRDARYRVQHGTSVYEGIVRHDPVEKETIIAAAFTGNSPGPGGGMISKQDVVENVNRIDPDVLLFTGDQVYQHNNHAQHWIEFGETFGDLTRSRPTVTIPDDHDVGHGNLWGAGGRHTERMTDGGYVKPSGYVNMVQRQQTSHLPDPYDSTPVDQGITVYYTSLNVGGIDFAIIEDRKFKSGCFGLVTEALGPRPDHVTSPNYDPAQFDLPGKQLLGERQLTFLDEWGKNWNGSVMKVVVSQTPFSMLSNYQSQNKSFYYADFDSNGWPQAGRNKAVDALRRCFAFHINGDQHLATIAQYGIDDWRDAGWSFCVPSIANLWLRWWQPKAEGKNPEPGAQDYTGDFYDGFSNRVTVYAHTNPCKSGREPAELHDRMPGFGIVRFNKKKRDITMECWPRMVDPTDPGSTQYTGWPRTIHQLDNYSRKAAAWLPELEIEGEQDPVVQVVDEENNEVVYTLRIPGNTFQPKVFKPGTYTIHIGEGNDRITLKGIIAEAQKSDTSIEVAL